jgi:hypothetical protein
VYRCMPHTCYLLDETNGIYCRTTGSPTQERCLLKRLGRRLALTKNIAEVQSPLFTFLDLVVL